MSEDVLRAGPPAALDELRRAQERHRLLASELDRVRGAALAWRNGLGALLAGLVGFGLLKGRNDVSAAAVPYAIAAGVFLLAALACGVCAALYLLRAAHGKPAVVDADAVQVREIADHEEALGAAQALRKGIGLTLVCTVLLGVAVGVTWYAPTRDTQLNLRVSTAAGTVCGTVQAQARGSVTLKGKDGVRQVALAEAVAVQPVESCP
ncbi:hypothetical protein ACIHFD_12100 [Nonomuraea sp. NPDC051941]|uniref:hypothetical protein n=1 Tax=Nonomuraea sp. NPDC051941 TaxID=3364373 RepID=UPI0037CC8BC1